MQKSLSVLFLVGLFACRQSPPKQSTKILDFGAFTINTPASWEQIKERGADSYVGRIALDKKDTLDFDLGWYSDKLEETDPVILDSVMLSDMDTSSANFREIIFVKSRMSVDIDKYRKNNVSWDTIDGRSAKIVYPRKTGIGTTGIYIDTVRVGRIGVDRFNLYGTNLSPDNETKVLAAIRTLKFSKKIKEQ